MRCIAYSANRKERCRPPSHRGEVCEQHSIHGFTSYEKQVAKEARKVSKQRRAQLLGSAAPTLIQRATAEHYKLPIAFLRKGARQPHIVRARYVACYLEHEAGKPYSEISLIYGYADHSTASLAAKVVGERLVANDEDYTIPVLAISMLVQAKKKEAREKLETEQLEQLSCPTCGAPVVAELRRQIAALTEKVAQLTGEK